MNQPYEGIDINRRCTASKIPHKVRIALTLRGSISTDRIRRDLEIARSYGLDPREVYEECVQELLEGHWNRPFPPYGEVEPAWVSTPITLAA